MPKEHKQRGRRADKKRKLEEESTESPLKKSRVDETVEEYVEANVHHDRQENFVVDGDAGQDFIGFHEKADPLEDVFYGLLDEEENEYYASINRKLDSNDFEDAEDRAAFIDAVYRESKGKELKIACSQSCSRYLERLILASSPKQLRSLFDKFKSNFLHLVQHRFASHCCETLFLQSARFLGEDVQEDEPEDGENALPSFEQLYLETVQELSDNIGYLLTERFASHAVRVLIVILSGEPLDQASTSSILASRKKEGIETATPVDPTDKEVSKRHVPESFGPALQKLIGSATASLNTTYLRALATHPTGNPVLQLLLQLELSGTAGLNAKDKASVFTRLFPDDTFDEGSDSAHFAQGLLFDPSGSRLLEAVIQHASGKVFKKLYKSLWKEKMATIAKNDTASYVAIRIVQRLGKDELGSVVDLLLPDLSGLLERNRVALVKTLIERCKVRELDLQPLLPSLQAIYGSEPSGRLPSMLKWNDPTSQQPSADEEKPATEVKGKAVDLHGSLLAQAILQTPKLSPFLHESLLALDPTLLVAFAKDASASRVIQVALQPASSAASFRRQFVPKLIEHLVDLATEPSGSYVVDAMWDGTNDLQFLKDRTARELQLHEAALRESRFGRVVWRNWSMDTFNRRRGDWKSLAKGHLDNPKEDEREQPVKQSGIAAARARFAAKQAQAQRVQKRNPTSAASGPNALSANA